MDHRRHFGEFVRAKRMKKGLTLRKFCEISNQDPGNVSKIERGLLGPSKEKLGEYASFLGIEKDSEDWHEFFILAATSKGEIPREILEDPELAPHLPIIFRTIRGKKVSEEILKEIVEIIRKS
jgi:transcriptional regulator with XRE-family HTH domain